MEAHKHWLFSSLLFIAIGSSPIVNGATFTNLGASTGAVSISGDGSTVIGVSKSPSTLFEAYKWTQNAGFVYLGVPITPYVTNPVRAVGVSYDGSVIVGATAQNSLEYRNWSWTQDTGVVIDNTLPTNLFVTGISSDGTRTSGSCGINTSCAGENAYFSGPAGTITMVAGHGSYGISGDGTVVIGHDGFQKEGVYWDITTTLDGFGNEMGYSASASTEIFNGYAYGLSHDGSVIVGRDNGLAARWTQANGMEIISGSLLGAGFDTTADGSTVVGYGYDSNGSTSHATIWDATNGWRSLTDMLLNDHGLDLSAWDLDYAYAISDDGNIIVGTGGVNSGSQFNWVMDLTASPVPVPAGIWLFGSGLLGLIGVAKRKVA